MGEIDNWIENNSNLQTTHQGCVIVGVLAGTLCNSMGSNINGTVGAGWVRDSRKGLLVSDIDGETLAVVCDRRGELWRGSHLEAMRMDWVDVMEGGDG